MSTIIDQEKIQRKLYSTSISLIDNNINEQIPDSSIIAITVDNDYVNNFFPILKIDLLISTYLFKLILNNKNTIKFRIKIESYIREEGMKAGDFDAKINKQLIFNDVFQPILQRDLTDDQLSELNKNEIKEDEPTRPLDVYLFNLNAMNTNKKIINFIAKDCKIKDVIGYIVNEFKINSLLMSNPTNTKTYNQIINPPLNLRNSIEFLSNTYGIYNSGLRQFYDFNDYYILSNDVKNVPVKPGEYQNVFLQICRIKEPGSLNHGSYIDNDNKCYMVNANNDILITKNGIMNKELNGNKIRVYDRNLIENSVEYNEKNGTFKFNKGYKEINLDVDGYVSNDKVAYIFNETTENNVTSLSTNIEYSNIEFVLQLSVIDLNIFKPNRNYIFRFEDSKYFKYNGHYIIDSLVYVIDNTIGEISGSAKFRKIQ